jgi:type IV pilus assembly protein PilO
MKLTRENVLTFLNVHLLVVLILAIANIVLFTRLALAWNTLRTDSTEQIQQYQANLKTLELQTAPLRDLPAKVETSEKDALAFYEKRMPSNYSSISAELVQLADQNHVRQAHLTYTPTPALPGLVQVALDASLAGEYAPIMRYINGVERNKLLFVINGLTLAGQQGGNVNVRLRMTTYIHAANAESLTPPAEEGSPDEAKPSAASAPAANADANAGGR